MLGGALLAAQVAQAQEPKIDSATLARANKPILRKSELIGVLVATGAAVALDQTLRDRIYDPSDAFGRTASDIGNAYGGPFVYPTLLVAAVGGKVLGSKAVYGVSSRALKATLLGGASAIVIKVLVGRARPSKSPNDRFLIHPISFKDNSFPSGHAAVAFALATSLAREIPGKWDDLGFFSVATLTGYARMHDDRHWFSDVVFGAGVGILSARFVHRREAKLLLGKKVLGLSFEF